MKAFAVVYQNDIIINQQLLRQDLSLSYLVLFEFSVLCCVFENGNRWVLYYSYYCYVHMTFGRAALNCLERQHYLTTRFVSHYASVVVPLYEMC